MAALYVLVIVLLFLNGEDILIPRVNAKSSVHIIYMGERQHSDPKLATKSHHEMLASVIESQEDALDSLVYSYRHGFSGFAAKLIESQVQKISEWKTDPFGESIFAEGSPRKLADPFDYGGGLVNPNRAAEPGLVYDMGTPDYIHYFCAYNDSVISQLVGQATKCPTASKPSILDVNLPSITIPSLEKSATLTRTVTNVGPSNSIYRALIEPPQGITVTVRPDVLVFNSTTSIISFTVAVSTTHKVNGGYYFGSLTWTDEVHTVTIPISVRTQIIQSYADDN